jgi:two-component system sensor histidine kinase TctE
MPVAAPRSLRQLLLLWLLPSILVMLALSMLGDYMIAIRPATRAYDQSLRDNAVIIKLHLVTDAAGNIALRLTPEAEKILLTEEHDRNAYAVYHADGRLIAGTPGLLPATTPLQPTQEGFFDISHKGEDLRLFVHRTSFNGQPIVIQTADTTNKRQSLSRQIIFGMFLPELLTIISVMAVVWVGVRRGLAPLDRLQRMVAAGQAPAGTNPLPEGQAPTELHGLVHVHNIQAEKLLEALTMQEHFITNAAHQLRTPLAGLQTQSELALKLLDRGGDADSERGDLRKIVSNIHTATMRASRLVQQLLGLARSTATGDAFGPCDLAHHAENVANRFMDRAVAANIDLGLELESVVVPGIGMLLEELISNLLDNALRYCPLNSSITIRTGRQDGHAFLVVEDNGPGVPADQYEKIFERFYRLVGEQEGAGLGLAIVQEIVRLHAATISAGPGMSGQGLAVRVVFRAAA